TGRPLPPEQATWTELTPSSRTSDLPGTSSQPSQSEGVGSSRKSSSPRQPGLDPGSIGENVSAEMSAEGIIVCQHPEHGTVYTNAANCSEVDYDNRLSQAEPYEPIANPDRYKNNDYQAPQNAAANSRSKNTSSKQQVSECDKTSLRMHARSPPKGLNVSCRFSVGKALEIERSLAVADDPAESTWLDSYCKWVNEAEKDECNIPSGTYCFIEHCPRWYPAWN
ncbi:MAG TPA: hypothetical protein VJN01_06295, partial [Xanthomonadales bacterium]|nr:hypothetical protein [Xanthomonadales bacterium]